MAAVAQRGVQPNFAWLWRQHRQDLGHANGPVHARRRLAACHDLVDGVGVAERVEFLVFFGKAARVGTGVAHAALVGWGFVGHAGIVRHLLSMLTLGPGVGLAKVIKRSVPIGQQLALPVQQA